MPVDLKKILSQEATTRVPLGDVEITIVYNAAALTPRLYQELKQADDIDGLAPLLSHLLIRWDVMDGEKPYPTTVEALSELPIVVLTAVTGAILEGLVPNPKSGDSTGSFS
jgi:hypothetical protein